MLVMRSNVYSPALFGRLSRHWFCSAAVTRASASEPDARTPQTLTRYNKLKTGLIIASHEDFCSPVSKIAIAFRSGSRYETGENEGITHALRLATELSTEGVSCFGLVKAVGQLGASLSVTTSRDYFVYNVECLREHTREIMNYVHDIIHKPAFFSWELPVLVEKEKYDLAVYAANQEAQLIEMLHDAAYRGSMARSLYMPDYAVGQHSPEMMKGFMNSHYRLGDMAAVGIGIGHEFLSEVVQLTFKPEPGMAAQAPSARYAGGESRKGSRSPLVHTAVVCEGASWQNVRDVAALQLLASTLTNIPGVKFGASSGKLEAELSKATSNPVAVTGLNIAHSDTGLFGFSCRGYYRDMEQILGSVFRHMLSVSKSGLSGADLAQAKLATKTQMLMMLERRDMLLDSMLEQALGRGEVISTQELVDTVNSVRAEDVATLAKRVVGGRPSMAAIGNLEYTPHLNDLIP